MISSKKWGWLIGLLTVIFIFAGMSLSSVLADQESVYMVKIRQPGAEKKIEDFHEFPVLQTLWQLPAYLSLKPDRPSMTMQFLMVKLPVSSVDAWAKAGYYRIDSMFVTITVERSGYCFGMPSGTVKKTFTTAIKPEASVGMMKKFFADPFGSLKSWNQTRAMSGAYDALIRASRQDNGWKFKFQCSLGVKIPALEDQLSHEISKANGMAGFKVGFKEEGLPLPVFEMGVEPAYVENKSQGPAIFESPINMGDMKETGASVNAVRGRDAWVRDMKWSVGKSKPYGSLEFYKDNKVDFIVDYSRKSFAEAARKHLQLIDPK